MLEMRTDAIKAFGNICLVTGEKYLTFYVYSKTKGDYGYAREREKSTFKLQYLSRRWNAIRNYERILEEQLKNEYLESNVEH
jgi:hypothetical protein